jgi:hypothetical protein
LLEDSWQQKLGNGLLFNLSWVLIVTSQSVLWAGAVVLLHLLIHLQWLGRGHTEVIYIAVVAAFGIALDQLLFAIGLFKLNGTASLAPLWLSCLWPVLATTMGHAFSGLGQRPVVAAILGAGGGAGSYIAGTRLSAVEFADPLLGPILIGLLWAVLFPLLALTAKRAMQGDTDATHKPA